MITKIENLSLTFQSTTLRLASQSIWSYIVSMRTRLISTLLNDDNQITKFICNISKSNSETSFTQDGRVTLVSMATNLIPVFLNDNQLQNSSLTFQSRTLKLAHKEC